MKMTKERFLERAQSKEIFDIISKDRVYEIYEKEYIDNQEYIDILLTTRHNICMSIVLV